MRKMIRMGEVCGCKNVTCCKDGKCDRFSAPFYGAVQCDDWEPVREPIKCQNGMCRYYKTKPDVLTCSHYGVVYMALGSITMTTNVCTELPELLERVIINAHDGLDV